MLRSLIIMTAVIFAFSAGASATNYYLSPTGSNENDGLSPLTPWATLQYARAYSPGLGAGDTLFIMGGTYTSAQYWHDEIGERHGTPGNPLVFKAYGDGVATFITTGPHPSGRWYYAFFMFHSGNCDNIVIDGYGYQGGEPNMIRLEGHDARESDDMGAAYLVSFEGSSNNRLEYGLIRGCEVMGGTEVSKVSLGIEIKYCRYGTVENNYVHHIHRPTGDILPGDNTDRHQGEGYGIFILSSELILVQNNRVERCNHGSIEMGRVYPDGSLSCYNRIVNNVIEQHYGGGIYLQYNSHHNLIEGNVITHCGETTTFAKPAMQISCSSNTIRNNVVYNPVNQALRIEATSFLGSHYIADNNLIYNNTVFGSRYSLGTTVNNAASSDCSLENNTIANNIFYRSVGLLEDINRASEIGCSTYLADLDHNWCNNDGDCYNCLPHETHWGGNDFHNNCIRRNSEGAAYTQLVVWSRDVDCIDQHVNYSLDDLQNADPVAWVGNIAENPLIASEYPDQYGITNNWWYLQETSPCIDAGIPVNDVIGAYVESLYPGYGWGNLTYADAAPDMGAHEFNGENPAPLSAPSIRINPSNR